MYSKIAVLTYKVGLLHCAAPRHHRPLTRTFKRNCR